jgi:hypothetical protein
VENNMAKKNDRFKRNADNEFHGGSLIGYVTLSFKDLKKIFGAPNGGTDGYKVSTSWKIVDTVTGNVFEIYDYKETNLYERGMPSPAAFRRRDSYDWHLGGSKLDKAALSAFLSEKLGFDVRARGESYGF